MPDRPSRWFLIVLILLAYDCKADGPQKQAGSLSQQQASPPTPPGKVSKDAGAKVAPVSAVEGPAPGNSIYQLQVALTDQDGKPLALDAFAGHPVIISMFYSSCTSMCPLLITHLHRVEEALSKEERAELRILLVSLDPERDTPEKLAEVAVAQHVDTTRFRLTRTTAASVQELAAVLNVRYRRLPSGEIAHSSILTVLDRAGVVAARVEDSSTAAAEVVKALSRLMSKP
jgi:protein SCO1/2